MASSASTRWSQVAAAGGSGDAARTALAWLCERYWDCLLAHARRRGWSASDAEDLTQDFMLELLGGSVIPRADPARGRFRTFLLSCLDHHLLHARDRRQAQKRGGGAASLALEADALTTGTEALTCSFDRDWAELVVHRARRRVESDEPALRWLALAPFLSGNGDADAYARVGARLGLREGAVEVAVHRLRERFRVALREEVGETLDEADPRLIDAEIQVLLKALHGPR